MKNTGIVRKVDELGRVVLPVELRNKLDIKEKDELQIWVNGKDVVLRKEEDTCVFCDKSKKDLQEFNRKKYCQKCIAKILA